MTPPMRLGVANGRWGTPVAGGAKNYLMKMVVPVGLVTVPAVRVTGTAPGVAAGRAGMIASMSITPETSAGVEAA